MKPHPAGYVVKLVRDGVAEALGGDGEITYKPLPRDEHVERLRLKLIEEAVEYSLTPSLEELSHVADAVAALLAVDLDSDWDALETQRMKTAAERGGFFAGIGMYATHPYDR